MNPGTADERTSRHTVTGGATRRAAHAARPPVPARIVLIALAGTVLVAGILAVVVQNVGSAPSAPGSAQHITAPARTGTAPT